MSTKREKIEPGFKKAVAVVWQKIKDKTVCYEDMVQLLELCDNKTKLQVGYHQLGYATYCFSDCFLFARKFLTDDERTKLDGVFKEKEYSFMSDSQKKFADHMRNPENEKAFWGCVESVMATKAAKESNGKTKH